MKINLAFAVIVIVGLSGCEPQVQAGPIDPPAVKQSFSQADKAQDLLGRWMARDDSEKQEAAAALAKQTLGGVFSDPESWPDCEKLADLATTMASSDSVYGVSSAPDNYRRATAMGCSLPTSSLAATYEQSLRKILEDRQEKVSDEDVALAGNYLEFQSRLGSMECATHSMRVSREIEKPFTDAFAAIEADCSRPR